jgi:signal recognition particle receptor subunit beta
MDMNMLTQHSFDLLDSKCDLIDIPGQGFYKTKFLNMLDRAKCIVVFLDSTDKHSLAFAADYIYELLNSQNYDETIPIIIACNKQDLKFAKSKKIIESELKTEVDNIKNIKQKNNIEDTNQIGTLSVIIYNIVYEEWI